MRPLRLGLLALLALACAHAPERPAAPEPLPFVLDPGWTAGPLGPFTSLDADEALSAKDKPGFTVHVERASSDTVTRLGVVIPRRRHAQADLRWVRDVDRCWGGVGWELTAALDVPGALQPETEAQDGRDVLSVKCGERHHAWGVALDCQCLAAPDGGP